ncbi:hypothetical protein [Geobacillus jurassicus]|uniref:Uncharacterized protein n=1 Tax=Geobacillus jurassicus TaxID=235932 RepID=A0ABV6GQY4_9BACL|nr:hypothetical protein [Geobacillus jurassicus]
MPKNHMETTANTEPLGDPYGKALSRSFVPIQTLVYSKWSGTVAPA